MLHCAFAVDQNMAVLNHFTLTLQVVLEREHQGH